ncbi:MAG: FAD-dependent monooxygenase [Alphaproteobacteria bacterium]|nr:FAD-dependent monooxygenase [Alphaproteobacteria bacterium]
MTNTKNNQAPEKADVIISGGGIAGLTLAVLLGRIGAKIALIDPSPLDSITNPKQSGRTVALMQTSLNILKSAGLSTFCESSGSPLEVMRIIDDSIPGGKVIEADFDSNDINLPRFSMNLPNGPLRKAIFEEAKKIKTISLHMPRTLEDYEVNDHGVTATLDNGAQIEASLIVGADGRGSLVRKIAGIGCWKKEYDQSAITCVINHSLSHNNTATEFHRPSGPLALVPLPGNRSSIVWVERRARAEEIIALPKDAFEQKLQDSTKEILGAITLETGPECWPLCTIKARKMTAPRVALIAEAAHVMSPITAQGLNLSLRDVASLAETIADALRLGIDPGSREPLRRYERRRSLDVTSRVLGVNRMNEMVSTDIPPLKTLRRTGLSFVDRILPVRNFAMQHGLAPHLDQGRLMQGKKL